ncbi:MAG: hypothetical protein ACRDA3_00085 [Peptostreptococcaceae bacterium]
MINKLSIYIENFIKAKYKLLDIKYGSDEYFRCCKIFDMLILYKKFNNVNWEDIYMLREELIKQSDDLLNVKQNKYEEYFG